MNDDFISSNEILIFAQKIVVLEQYRESLAQELQKKCLISEDEILKQAYMNLEVAFEKCIVTETKVLFSKIKY